MTVRQRKQAGATMGLVVICCFVLVLLILGLFEINLLLGGSQELRNGVDAGTLNVGKQVCQDTSAKITLGAGDEQQFDDVLDRSGHLGLNNINRMLGKAFLIQANVQAMSGGFGSGSAGSHASTIYDTANDLAKKLADKLNDKSITQPFFDNYINSSSVRMLGGSSAVKATADGWDTAFTDRNEESNLRIDPDQLPSGFGLSADDTKSIIEKGAATDSLFLRGYRAYNVNSRTIALVPFKYDEKPHLISGFTFQQGKIPITWTSAKVPNCFASKGITVHQNSYPNTATAYAVANPQRQYQLAIPHAFVRIKLDDNDVKYFVNVEPDHSSTYQSLPGQAQTEVVIHPVGSGTLHGSAVLGNEYIPPNLHQAIHALGNHDEVTKALLQRIREIKHDFTEGELNGLLNKQVLIPGTSEYLIYPVYTTADNTDPSIHCNPSAIAKAEAPWLKTGAHADGSQQTIATEDRPAFSTPNTGTEFLTGTGCKPGPVFVSEDGELKWTPGSGYDQCLGDLEIHRTTTVRYTGVCTGLI